MPAPISQSGESQWPFETCDDSTSGIDRMSAGCDLARSEIILRSPGFCLHLRHAFGLH